VLRPPTTGTDTNVAGLAARALGTAVEAAERALAPLGLVIDEIPRQQRALAERGTGHGRFHGATG
jgi:hypothetical protein